MSRSQPERAIGADAIELEVVRKSRVERGIARAEAIANRVLPQRSHIQVGAKFDRVKTRRLRRPMQRREVRQDKAASDEGDSQHVVEVIRIRAGQIFLK